MVIRGLLRYLVSGMCILGSIQAAAPTLMKAPTKKKTTLMQSMHKGKKPSALKKATYKTEVITKKATFTEKKPLPKKAVLYKKKISPKKKTLSAKTPLVKKVEVVHKKVETQHVMPKKVNSPGKRKGFAEFQLRYMTTSTFVCNRDLTVQEDHYQSRFSNEGIEISAHLGRLMPVAKNIYFGQEVELEYPIIKHNYKTGKIWPVATTKIRKLWGGSALLSFHKDFKYYMSRLKIGVAASKWQLKAARTQGTIRYRKEKVLPGIQYSIGAIFPITYVEDNKLNVSMDFTQARYKTMKATENDNQGVPNQRYIIRPITHSFCLGLTYLF